MTPKHLIRPHFLLAGLVVLASLASSFALGVPDTSPRSRAPQEWKDSHGRVIKRLDDSGRLTLLTWDDAGRLVRIAQLARRFSLAQAAGPLEGGPAWVHGFVYDEDGRLAREIDCRGEAHEHSLETKIDLLKGTALSNHEHLMQGAPHE